MRMIIWHGLVARGILSSMLLVFSLLAVSLVWSAGQRLDVWAFLFFNLRGSRPVWLDWMMLSFTQIGSGIAALVIGLDFVFCRRSPGCVRTFSGDFNVMDSGGACESTGATLTTNYPSDSGAHRRLPGQWTIFPKRAYQPGLLYGDADGLTFPCQPLVGDFAVRHRPVGGHHTHVCGGALPAGRAGGGYPGQRLGTVGSAC